MARTLRGVFFGTSEFALPALRAFARATECAFVVTQPDRPAGRGQRLQPTAVKAAARELGIPVLEPARLREALPSLRAANPDVFAVASYGKIVPQAALDVPRLGALNVHPSLLPLYRGASPLQSQLRDGVVRSGVTIILMDAGMDTGDIVLVRHATIGARETYGELHDRFAALGGELLAQALEGLAAGTLVRIPQAGLAPESEVLRTLTRPLGKADLAVDWDLPAERLVNQIRALAPRPGARGRLGGEADAVKILEASVVPEPAPGELTVPCGAGGFLRIERLVPAGRKPMSGAAYLAGAGAAGEAAR